MNESHMIQMKSPSLESPQLLLAKNLFISEQYQRASYILRNQVSIQVSDISQSELFIWGYSSYLSGEKSSAQTKFEKSKTSSTNPNLEEILSKYEEIENGDIILDPFNSWLYATCLLTQTPCFSLPSPHSSHPIIHKALSLLIDGCLSQFPIFWSAWEGLSTLLTEFF